MITFSRTKLAATIELCINPLVVEVIMTAQGLKRCKVRRYKTFKEHFVLQLFQRDEFKRRTRREKKKRMVTKGRVKKSNKPKGYFVKKGRV